jgi:hypothetical protein
MNAAEILNLIIRTGDAGNLAEMLYDIEDNTLAARIHKAHDLGFYQVDEFGTITATSKGAAYLAKAA